MFENTTVQSTVSPKSGSASKFTYWILAVFGFLLPFFFIPSASYPLQLGKGMFMTIAIVLAIISFIVSTIKDGKVVVPKNLFFLSVFLIPVVFLFSAIFNGSSSAQFLGYPFELGTVVFMFFSVVLMYLVSRSFETKEKIFYSFIGFFASFIIVALFQLLRIMFGTDFLSFGVFTNSVGNLIGNWNDVGIFFAIATILSVVTLEMLQLNRLLKVVAYAVFVLSLFFLALVNFSTLWIVLAVFSVVFFIYIISFDKFAPSQEFANDLKIDGSEGAGKVYTRKISYNALVVLVISVIFIIAGTTIGQSLSDTFNVLSLEVRPSWSSTFTVVGEVLKSNPTLGSGPNTFQNMWVLHKPLEINQTIFWNSDFSYGIGLVPTLFATTGVLGILVWLFFFGMFIWLGVKTIFYSLSDLFSRYVVTTTFLISLFLWAMSIFYVPSVVIVALTFFFTGLFAASLEREGMLKTKTFSLSDHPKLSFVSVLLLMFILIGSVTLGYMVFQRSASLVYFQKSLNSYQKDQNVDTAGALMAKAVNLGGYDVYYRVMSQIDLARVNQLLAKPGITPESIRDPFQKEVGTAIANAKKSTEISPENYQNWISLAQVYAALVPQPFAIPGAYENALTTFNKAVEVAPMNPTTQLLLARLEVAHNDVKKAREYAAKAVELKSNYAEAHFLLAQIEATEGNVAKAISSLETTLLLSPENPGLFFQLGLLKYNQKDFEGAVQAFAQAVVKVPDYANARYFLGLSLYNIDRVQEALAQFEEVAKTNPDNQELMTIITNLKSGKAPLATIPPPGNKPETRDKLPLEQRN